MTRALTWAILRATAIVAASFFLGRNVLTFLHDLGVIGR